MFVYNTFQVENPSIYSIELPIRDEEQLDVTHLIHLKSMFDAFICQHFSLTLAWRQNKQSV